MKKTYDFSKGEKNPYYKKLKGKKLQLTEEISFELSDLVQKIKKLSELNQLNPKGQLLKSLQSRL